MSEQIDKFMKEFGIEAEKVEKVIDLTIKFSEDDIRNKIVVIYGKEPLPANYKTKHIAIQFLKDMADDEVFAIVFPSYMTLTELKELAETGD